MLDVVRTGRAVVAFGIAMALAVCSPISGGSINVPTGVWGGDHIAMEVTDKGAQLDFDCAHGSIDEPLVLDNRGRFTVKGSYTAEAPGPQHDDQNQRTRPALYAGAVEGSSMTVTISFTDKADALGPFLLTRGKTAKITKCL